MFSLIFSCVGMMLAYMIIGFVLCKVGKANVDHTKSLSAILLYVLGPAMIINSFLKLDYSTENLISIGKYFVVSLVIQLLFFAILYAVLNKKYDDSKYRIMTVGSVLGNVGYMGMPLIASIFPDNPIALCYSSINVTSMNLIVFTLGTFMITNDRKFVSIKNALLNPTTISLYIALPLYLLQVNIIGEVGDAISLLAKMVTPICMLILGIRLSACDLIKIFTRPFVYITCALKLLVFPMFAFLLVHWLPFVDDVTKITIVVLAMAPSGAVIESLAEMYECEQEFAANVVLLATILCVITIPAMAFILV